MSAPYSDARSSRSSPAENALMTIGTRTDTYPQSSNDSVPCSWAASRPARCTVSTTRLGSSSRKTPTVQISRGRRRVMAATAVGLIWRGEGANTNPRASAPIATAIKALPRS